MTNSYVADKLKNRKCYVCKKKGCIGIVNGLRAYCSIEHQAEIGLRLAREKKKNEDKEFKRETKAMKKEAMTRTEWYDRLQDLVNQYVVHVRDKDKPCCTCGKTDPSVKYDAGHYLSRGARPELRFELTNIHKQCSMECNVHGSSMRPEYNQFIIDTYGMKHYEWLNGPHEMLKDKFPHWSDIENEIKRCRVILRSHGLKPRW